jgi:hypothetical protein
MAEDLNPLRVQAERLKRLLREEDFSDNWTVEPLPEKSRVLVTAERGRPNEKGWLRTCVVLPLDMLEALDDGELVRQVRRQVKVYRLRA